MNFLKHKSLFGCQSVIMTVTGKIHQYAKYAKGGNRFTSILSSKFHSGENALPKPSVELKMSCHSQERRQNSFVQQKSRHNRRKRPLTMLFKHKKQNVTTTGPLREVNCVPIAEGLDIDAMCGDLNFTNYFTLNYVDDNKIAVHCQRKAQQKAQIFDDFFVFAEGVVVFWDVDRNSQQSIINLLRKYQHNSFTDHLKDDEEETMTIDFTPGPSYASNDVVFLNSERHQNAEHSLNGSNSEMEQFAFSHAMAASVKMGIWEQTLDKYLDDKVQLCIEGMKDKNGRWWNLRRNGIPWTHKKALRMIGNFADLRHAVNSTDLLSKDVYWDLPEVESVYGSLARRLCLQSRRNLINERLGHCEYFSKTISEALNIEHSHFLEVVIILLIAFECAHVATDWLGFGHKNQQRQLASTTQKN